MKVIYEVTIADVPEDEVEDVEQVLTDLAENDVLEGAISMALDGNGVQGVVVNISAAISGKDKWEA